MRTNVNINMDNWLLLSRRRSKGLFGLYVEIKMELDYEWEPEAIADSIVFLGCLWQ